MGRLNAAWHFGNVMPQPATPDERIAGHLALAEACGCRAIPKGVIALMAERGIAAPGAEART